MTKATIVTDILLLLLFGTDDIYNIQLLLNSYPATCVILYFKMFKLF